MSTALMDSLGTLSPAELKELQARATALLGSGSAADETVEGMIHDAIEVALRSFGAQSVLPLRVVRQQAWYKDFKAGSAELLAFIDECVKPTTKLERIKVVRVFVRMIARQLSDWQVPVSYKTLAQNLKKVATIADLQFPGYQACGLLGVIVRKNAG
jgi:hypothetical protein